MGNEQSQNSRGDMATVPCRVCAEPIRSRALKCTKCGSYQDWTRHLLRWSALLVSLFALAPLWSISGSLSKMAFTKKSAELEAAVTACNHQEVRVAFENSGELSGIVTNVDFAFELNGERRVPQMAIKHGRKERDILVVPGNPPEIVTYRAYIEGEPSNFFPANLADQQCRYLLGIYWTDLQGETEQLSRECRCR